MDKQLLDALNNIGDALELLVDALQNKEEAKTATGAALQSGDFGKQLETISTEIKSIKADTQQIIKNQQTIIALSKQKETDKKTGEFEGASDPKKESAIKKGVATILLIAVAVLAIGAAFKLVGNVNVLSVIGLALAITIISLAFEKVANLKIGIKEAAIASLTMVMLSIAITVSSWFLSLIKPISLLQAFSAVMIGAMFGAVAFGLGKMLEAFSKIGIPTLTKSVIFFPLILPAIALGIALASYALQLVKPIGIMQFFGAVMVGLVFVVLAFGIKKILSAFQGIDPGTAVVASFMIPVLFTAMSLAIWASSELLSLVKPISFVQFLVSLAIAIIFIPISYAMAPVLFAISQMKWGDVPKIPVFFTLISLAIMISSHILAETADIGFVQLLKIALLGITLALIVTLMSLPVQIVGKIPIKDIALGSLGIILIATAIMVASHILSIGNYDKYPDWKWALGVGMSLLAFTPAIVALGFIAISGVGALAILAGSGMILLVAASIIATSHILAQGNYDKFPPIKWTLGVAAAMIPFSLAILTLGTIALTGIGAVAFLVGIPMIVEVAKTIVEVADILAKGKYENKGMLQWAAATALLYGTFTPILLILGAVGLTSAVMDFFGPNPWDMAREMMVQIAETIVDVSFVLQKGSYKSGPTKEWADGVAIALGAFAPVYEVLAANSGWFSSGVSVDDMRNAILTISEGIVDAAKFFAENKSPFTEGNYPTEAWSKGVGSALGAFAPVFKSLSEDTGWLTSGDDVIKDMVNGIKSISRAIVSVNKIFKGAGKWESYPSETWSNNVKKSVEKFVRLSKYLSEQDAPYYLAISVADKMTKMAKILYKGKDTFGMVIDPNYIKNVGQNMIDFNELVSKLVEAEGNKSILDKLGSATDSMLGTDPISQIARRMITLAEGYDKLASSLLKLGSAMKSLNISDVKQLGGLTKELVGEPIVSKAENQNIAKIKAGTGPTVAGTGLSTKTVIDPQKAMMFKKLDKIVQLLSNIDKSSSSINSFIQGMEDTNVSTTNI